MPEKRDIGEILAEMGPVLHPDTYVFSSLKPGVALPEGLEPVGTFREIEGLTLIVREEDARRYKLIKSAPMRAITLNVHSSLEAVGLTAAIASALTAHNISANVVAGFYHDHVFVGAADGERAVTILRTLAERSA